MPFYAIKPQNRWANARKNRLNYYQRGIENRIRIYGGADSHQRNKTKNETEQKKTTFILYPMIEITVWQTINTHIHKYEFYYGPPHQYMCMDMGMSLSIEIFHTMRWSRVCVRHTVATSKYIYHWSISHTLWFW